MYFQGEIVLFFVKNNSLRSESVKTWNKIIKKYYNGTELTANATQQHVFCNYLLISKNIKTLLRIINYEWKK